MTEKRFERIYEDVDVFCRDHNAKEVSQLIERDDYDRIVDLLNELNDENEELKQFKEKIFTSIEKEIARNEKTIEWKKETLDLLNELLNVNKQLKQQNEFLKKRCNEYWEESGLNNDYFEWGSKLWSFGKKNTIIKS